ncbi:MAG: hypothetical protein SF339_00735 [Blastocatellia bacterium]|nr:hypothetical protein [Blastocatellia bacterium]
MKRSSFLAGLLFALMAMTAVAAIGSAQEKKEKFKYAELESFHELLSPIWHQQYPAKEWGKIRAQSGELVRRKDAIMNLRLRTKSDQQTRIEELKKNFGVSVDALAKAAKSGPDEDLQKSVATMHEAFETFADAVR